MCKDIIGHKAIQENWSRGIAVRFETNTAHTQNKTAILNE